MSNKETLQSYNTKLSESNETLNTILDTINNLPEASDGMYAPRFISFQACQLEDLTYEVENLDTSNMTSFNNIFSSCTRLATLDLSRFNVSNVTTMINAFGYCTNLQSLNVKDWDTSNVTNMSETFVGVNYLKSLDLSGWNTSKVKTMTAMFNYCSSLTFLDIRNFDFSSVTNAGNMFSYVGSTSFKKACTIVVKDDTAKQYVLSLRSDLTKVKTVAEYEAGL